MSRFAWKAFANSATVRLVSIVVVLALLGGSIYGVWWSFTSPTERQELTTQASYLHSGSFDYQVYASYGTLYDVPPPEEEEEEEEENP